MGATENERTEFCCWAGARAAPDVCPWHPSSEGQSPSADAPGTGGSPNPERLSGMEPMDAVRAYFRKKGLAGPTVAHAEHVIEALDTAGLLNGIRCSYCSAPVGSDPTLCGPCGGESDMRRDDAVEAAREAEAREEELRERVMGLGGFERRNGWGTCDHYVKRDDVLSLLDEVYGPSAKGSSPESRPGLDGRE